MDLVVTHLVVVIAEGPDINTGRGVVHFIRSGIGGVNRLEEGVGEERAANVLGKWEGRIAIPAEVRHGGMVTTSAQTTIGALGVPTMASTSMLRA